MGFGHHDDGAARAHPGVEQATSPTSRTARAGRPGFGLEAQAAGEWMRLYNFDLVEALQADYEVSNWYLGHFPQSQFVTGLICARAAADMRHALRNTRYSVHHPGGLTERRFITRLDDLKMVLREAMKIPLPESPRLDAALERVLQATLRPNPSSRRALPSSNLPGRSIVGRFERWRAGLPPR